LYQQRDIKEFFVDAVPKSAGGKILRGLLRDPVRKEFMFECCGCLCDHLGLIFSLE